MDSMIGGPFSCSCAICSSVMPVCFSTTFCKLQKYLVGFSPSRSTFALCLRTASLLSFSSNLSLRSLSVSSFSRRSSLGSDLMLIRRLVEAIFFSNFSRSAFALRFFCAPYFIHSPLKLAKRQSQKVLSSTSSARSTC